ncbi:uncharacterized protein LOC134686355 [Mytilus trossulus]|uniref:uncharacterized protein LOC134686355 n=1 Tax=Mytilus trossulus TaxID=6551 RepID=UPI003004E653
MARIKIGVGTAGRVDLLPEYLQEMDLEFWEAITSDNGNCAADDESYILKGIPMIYIPKDKSEVKGQISITNKQLYFETIGQITFSIPFYEIIAITEIRSATKSKERFCVILKREVDGGTQVPAAYANFATFQQKYANQMYEKIRDSAFSKKQYNVEEKESEQPVKLTVKQPTFSQSKRKTDDDTDAGHYLPPPKRTRRECNRSTMNFLKRKFEHIWILKDGSKKCYYGMVTAVLEKSNGDDDAVYEVKYDGENGAIKLNHQKLLEDYRNSSLKFIGKNKKKRLTKSKQL